jgi:hypothetical protein
MLNPISTSNHFTEPNQDADHQSDEENTPQAKQVKFGDELEVEPPTVLSARDQNRDQ